jgi:FkbM family methyltransferase
MPVEISIREALHRTADYLTRGSHFCRELAGATRTALGACLRECLNDTDGPPLVLDVGAFHGLFARAVLDCRQDATVHCFEPQPGACEVLLEWSRSYHHVYVHPVAVGAKEGQIDLHVNEFGPASSVLGLAEACRRCFPVVGNVQRISVPVRTLDSMLHELDIQGHVHLLKLDVQGYEGEVLRGARELLARTRWLLTEVSFTPLYQGGILVDELCSYLRAANFELTGTHGWSEGRSGAPVQADFLFRRSS